MIYWFLLQLGCQACTKSLIMYVVNIDSYFRSFFILRSYVCRILGLYQVVTYVWRLYSFLMSTFYPFGGNLLKPSSLYPFGGNLLKPGSFYFRPTIDCRPVEEELKYSRNRARRHWRTSNDLLEVWQNSAIFGSRLIGAAVEALLMIIVNRQSSSSPIGFVFVAATVSVA